MNETLFSQIQRLFERTYAQVGINLEDCLIDQRRCRQLTKLAGASARELRASQKVPIGAVDDTWGGTPIRAWMNEESVRASGGAEYADLVALQRSNPTAAI